MPSPASGAYLKSIVAADDLIVANGRFESATWSSIAVGFAPPGAAIGLFGYVTTVWRTESAISSALGIAAIGGREAQVARTATLVRLRDLPDSGATFSPTRSCGRCS